MPSELLLSSHLHTSGPALASPPGAQGTGCGRAPGRTQRQFPSLAWEGDGEPSSEGHCRSVEDLPWAAPSGRVGTLSREVTELASEVGTGCGEGGEAEAAGAASALRQKPAISAGLIG